MISEGLQPTDQADASTAPAVPAAETTGRWLVTFAAADQEGDNASTLRSAGLSNLASSRDFEDQGVEVAHLEGSDGVLFAELGVAVVSLDPGRITSIRTAAQGAVLSVEPEHVLHVLQSRGPEYLRGYRDGVTDLSARLEGASDGAGVAAEAAQAFQDTAQFTWGLQAASVFSSPFTGRGIKVAVLDTGFNSDHPDFADRNITAKSFIAGQTTEDGHGHGTHCVGTSCGPRQPSSGVRRYGCATEAEIFVGKVLSDEGSGDDGGILAGINWAMANHTEVISMSLGADVAQVSRAYETVGRRALNRGCLIVAAAGNNAQRQDATLPPLQRFGFVGMPANSPSVMAVAALDEQLAIASFSARSLEGVQGGNIDLSGPGVRVFSSWNRPRPEQNNGQYRSISGTSMATPHVAGIAALWSQARNAKGRDLWALLTQQAQRQDLPSVDVGSGLVQAPQ